MSASLCGPDTVNTVWYPSVGEKLDQAKVNGYFRLVGTGIVDFILVC